MLQIDVEIRSINNNQPQQAMMLTEPPSHCLLSALFAFLSAVVVWGLLHRG